VGAGDEHKLERSNKPDIEFEPGATRYQLEMPAADLPHLNTGDAVAYDNGGGSEIGGLTNGETYYLIVGTNGVVQLAESRKNALKGEELVLTGTGTGSDHELREATHSAKSLAVSGASGGELGLAGSLAITVPEARTEALLASGGTAILQDGGDGDATPGDLSIKAVSSTYAGAEAKASQDETDSDADGDENESVGLGASVAITITDHDTRAVIENGASVQTATNVTLNAEASHRIVTKAKGGSEGGVALTPVFGMSVAKNDAEALVDAGPLTTLAGNLMLDAELDDEVKTVAEGDATGENAAVGVSLGLTIAEPKVRATLLRDVTSTGGTVEVLATGSSESETEAMASAEGAEEDDGMDGTSDDNGVNDRSQGAVDGANTQTASRTSEGSGTETTTASDASTSEGPVSVAAAIGLNFADATVTARFGDGITVMADQAVTIRASADADSKGKADGSASKGGTGTVGAAVGVNDSSVHNQARSGNSAITADGITIEAVMKGSGAHEQSAEAKSGASGGNVGLAGSLALNLGEVRTEASLGNGASVSFMDGSDGDSTAGDFTLSTVSKSKHLAKAEAHQEEGDADEDGNENESFGLGASVAVDVSENNTISTIGTGATFHAANIPANVSVSATGEHLLKNEAKGGGAGGTALTPVAAISVPQNTTRADVQAGGLIAASGDVAVTANQDADSHTSAYGAPEATTAAIGASFGLVIAEDRVSALLASDVTTDGAVTVEAKGSSVTRTAAKASAKGVASDDGADGSDDDDDVQQQTQSGVDEANERSDGGTDTTTAPDSSTSDGAVSVAAAIAVNSSHPIVVATLGGTDVTPATINAGGPVTVRTATNTDAIATADGSAVTVDDGTAVGAAVAINVSDTKSEATLITPR
jgi:hypothetical protein